MAKIKVPIIVTVIGEGGSGGALAIGVGDQVMMFGEFDLFRITPEGCAAILWKDRANGRSGGGRTPSNRSTPL